MLVCRKGEREIARGLCVQERRNATGEFVGCSKEKLELLEGLEQKADLSLSMAWSTDLKHRSDLCFI